MTNRSRSYHSQFDFLGFKLHQRAYRDNPRRFWIARQPSEKSRRHLHRALRERMPAHLSVTQVQARLRQTWLGWCNYFRYGNSNRILYRERNTIKRMVWWYLTRKFRRTRRPVCWLRLQVLARELMKDIRPVRVVNSRADEWPPPLLFGGA